jgi:hypothetical protein
MTPLRSSSQGDAAAAAEKGVGAGADEGDAEGDALVATAGDRSVAGGEGVAREHAASTATESTRRFMFRWTTLAAKDRSARSLLRPDREPDPDPDLDLDPDRDRDREASANQPNRSGTAGRRDALPAPCRKRTGDDDFSSIRRNERIGKSFVQVFASSLRFLPRMTARSFEPTNPPVSSLTGRRTPGVPLHS